MTKLSFASRSRKMGTLMGFILCLHTIAEDVCKNKIHIKKGKYKLYIAKHLKNIFIKLLFNPNICFKGIPVGPFVSPLQAGYGCV